MLVQLCHRRKQPLLTKDIQKNFHIMEFIQSTAMKMVTNSRGIGVKVKQNMKILNNL